MKLLFLTWPIIKDSFLPYSHLLLRTNCFITLEFAKALEAEMKIITAMEWNLQNQNQQNRTSL